MTPEAQRIAIAEACGWQSRTRNELHLGSPHTWTQWCNSEYPWGVTEPPDYLNDLNACHDMERFLTEKEEVFYLTELVSLMDEPGTLAWRLNRTYRAPARVRAQAFLHVLQRRTNA